MKTERTIVEFISRTRFDDIPAAVLETVKDEVRSVLGATIARRPMRRAAELCATWHWR